MINIINTKMSEEKKQIEALLEQWMDEPIKNINLLNKLVPLLITLFDRAGSE